MRHSAHETRHEIGFTRTRQDEILTLFKKRKIQVRNMTGKMVFNQITKATT